MKEGFVEKLMLKPNEVAETTGMGRSTIYALLASGELPSVRIGRAIRVPVEALKQWVAQNTSSGGEK